MDTLSEVEKKQQSDNLLSVGRVFQLVRRNPWKFFFGAILLYLFVEVATLPLGHIETLKDGNPSETAFMREHAEAARRAGRQFHPRQQWVPIGRIPAHAINAVIVAEDGTFWQHRGFDWYEFKESIKRNIQLRRFARGASTISQQLVKNLYLSSSKDPLRKLKEWILTWKLERTLSKRRILELYLNVIEWGDGIYGIEAASRHYFGKSVDALTREESARLAAVIPNPRKWMATADTKFIVRRTRTILERMAARGL